MAALWDEFSPGIRRTAQDVAVYRIGARAVLLAARRAQPAPSPDAHPDDEAVDRFAARMKAKLKWEREVRGRSGWSTMSADALSRLLYEHLPKGDPVDIANLSMMLSENEQRLISHAAPGSDVAGLIEAARPLAARYAEIAKQDGATLSGSAMVRTSMLAALENALFRITLPKQDAPSPDVVEAGYAYIEGVTAAALATPSGRVWYAQWLREATAEARREALEQAKNIAAYWKTSGPDMAIGLDIATAIGALK